MKSEEYQMMYRRRLLPLLITLPLLATLAVAAPVRAAPIISTSPAAGAAGTEITVTGNVFDSYKGDKIYVFFDNEEVAGSPLTVDQTGSFVIRFDIPADAAPGRYWIEARTDTSPGSMLAKTFVIVPETVITLDVIDGPIGTRVNVSGQGFHAGRTVTLYYYRMIGEKLGTTSASPTGDIGYTFTVPSSTGGPHRIVAENAEGNSAEAEFEVTPVLSLNHNSGGPGELLEVSGSGFGYRADVALSFGTYEVARALSDDYGTFQIAFNVPQTGPGPYDVKALDSESNLARATFTTTAGASLNKAEGPVGTPVTVRGSGFAPAGNAVISYDDTPITAVATDNNGAFSVTFNVPPGNGGVHRVTVDDGTTTRLLTFKVESDPPLPPDLLLPANASDTKAAVTFDWTDAEDPSQPVLYALQVAYDPAFTSIVASADDLTDSEFSPEEPLRVVVGRTVYYWRVKARDSASNESGWTPAWSLYVAPPATPALLLPAAGAALESPLHFDWQDATGLTPPITYTLQVASDQTFSAPVLEKADLPHSEYSVVDEETLPALGGDAAYYWRVKAVDSAGNESVWSTPYSFSVIAPFSMPGWAIYIIIIIVAVAAICLAFWLGRRTAYSNRPS